MTSTSSDRASELTHIHNVRPSLILKPPRKPFLQSSKPTGNVFFLHPGYNNNHNHLLTLPALDSGGIHHETARIACAILANSRWDGFLSHEKDGSRVDYGPDDILPIGRYYFRIDNDDEYPVVPSFDNFNCPAELPNSWSEAAAPIMPSVVDDVGKRDLTCRVTGSQIPNETAHIIPQAQSDWWQRNSMFTYAMNPDQGFDTKCADNTILLRRDLHKMWDDHRFAIVPKAGRWFLHLLMSSSTVELEEAYHNLELQPLRGVSHHYLLCRFALAILSKSSFLRQRSSRKLVILAPSGSPQIRDMSADEYLRLLNMTARANSRSQSPKKRQWSTQGEVDVIEDASACSDSTTDNDSEEDNRGRGRKRGYTPSSILDDNVVVDLERDSSKETSPLRKKQRHGGGSNYLKTPSRSTSPTVS